MQAGILRGLSPIIKILLFGELLNPSSHAKQLEYVSLAGGRPRIGLAQHLRKIWRSVAGSCEVGNFASACYEHVSGAIFSSELVDHVVNITLVRSGPRLRPTISHLPVARHAIKSRSLVGLSEKATHHSHAVPMVEIASFRFSDTFAGSRIMKTLSKKNLAGRARIRRWTRSPAKRNPAQRDGTSTDLTSTDTIPTLGGSNTTLITSTDTIPTLGGSNTTLIASIDVIQTDVVSLASLPADIIFDIAKFLSVVSAVNLAFTCSSIYRILRAKYIRLLRDDKHYKEHYDLLQLLYQDLPGHVVCFYCRKLHSIDMAIDELKRNGKCSRCTPPTHHYIFRYQDITVQH